MDHQHSEAARGNVPMRTRAEGSGQRLNYFAYGSNMSLARLRARIPSAEKVGSFMLREHSLRFHPLLGVATDVQLLRAWDSSRDVINANNNNNNT